MPEDVEWFDQSIAKLVGEKLGEKNQKIVECGLDRYFVDFLQDAPEDTGIDPLPVSNSVNCFIFFALLKTNFFFVQEKRKKMQI